MKSSHQNQKRSRERERQEKRLTKLQRRLDRRLANARILRDSPTPPNDAA